MSWILQSSLSEKRYVLKIEVSGIGKNIVDILSFMTVDSLPAFSLHIIDHAITSVSIISAMASIIVRYLKVIFAHGHPLLH